MIQPPDGSTCEPYHAPRGVCPICGSEDVMHLVGGMPSSPAALIGTPAWVQWIGSSEPGYDRTCRYCTSTWNQVSVDAQEPSPIRLLSEAGASFALLPAPNPANDEYPHVQMVDVELLAPHRLVRYLGRRVTREDLVALSHTCKQAARDLHPERSVPTVQSDEAGFCITVVQSTPLSATVEFLIIAEPDTDYPDHDRACFELPRVSLIDAAHTISGWLA